MKINSDIVIIVIHEIYGIDQHILGVCQRLQKLGYDVICPNLLKKKVPFTHCQEDQAYSYFMDYIGFGEGLKQVKEIADGIRSKYRKIFLLGYSIGATISWLCMDNKNEVNVDGMIGYYGSRIRYYIAIEPQYPTLLIMANQEKSFSAQELMPELNKKDRVQVHLLSGKHGFADPFSINYDKISDYKAREIVTEFLERHI